MLRLHVPELAAWTLPVDAAQPVLDHSLPAAAVRHVQVRRLQPGDTLQLFDGAGQEWRAELTGMARSAATIRLIDRVSALPELPLHVTLALAVPANDRMDSLIEKATELGVACIQPLATQHSVLRLDGGRADKRRAHWQGVASAAAEQCGRAWVPSVAPWRGFGEWLEALGTADPSAKLEGHRPAIAAQRWLLSPQAQVPLHSRYSTTFSAEVSIPAAARPHIICLSGPEGGLSLAEEAQAVGHGFVPLHLGARVLRADTAPLAVMAWLALGSTGP